MTFSRFISAAVLLKPRSSPGVAARVGRHDDDRILKVHRAAVGVGDAALVQNLQQDVQHVRVGLLNLVEQQHRVGPAADLLRQLAASS